MVCLMVGGWSRQETKLQLQQPHSRGARETGQMRPRRSSPGRSRSATTDDRQDHHSAMGLVRIPQLHISHFKSNSLKFTTSGIILVGGVFFPCSSQSSPAFSREQHGREGRRYEGPRRCMRMKTQPQSFLLTRWALRVLSVSFELQRVRIKCWRRCI